MHYEYEYVVDDRVRELVIKNLVELCIKVNGFEKLVHIEKGDIVGNRE